MESSAPVRPPPPPPLEVPSTSYGAVGAAPTSTSTSSTMSSKPAETAFRILCPASKTSRLTDIPGTRIRILEEFPVISGHDERVVLVSPVPREDASAAAQANSDSNLHPVTSSSLNAEDFPAHHALVRVFERIVSVDEEDKEKESSAYGERTVVFRLLIDSSRYGAWREGRLLEKMMQESGASVKLQPKYQLQAATPTDELIEIEGNISTVEKALKSLSSCPMDTSGVDNSNLARPGHYGLPHSASDAAAQVDNFPPRNHPLGRHHGDFQRGNHPHAPGHENFGPNRRMAGEAEVVFKLLCHQEKVGSLIGKGGSVIRALENDTGTYIKIVEGLSDTDERVVSISARENAEQKPSPAQDAVMRVQYRIAEIGFEPGNTVVARLYVPSHQVRYLLGKGGCIINEMRRATPCSIRVFPRDQAPKFANHNDEVVQVVGNLQAVQDTLFQITSRIREVMFPFRPSHNTNHAPAPGPYMPPPPYSEMGPPHVRPRHNPHSPGPYPPPQGPVPHGFDGSGPPRPFDPQPPPFPRGMEHNVPPNVERVPPYHYGGEQQGYGPPPPAFDRPPSPRMFAPQHQPFSGSNPRGGPDFGPRPHGSGNQGPIMSNSTVEVVIPQSMLGHVHGENNINLIDIRQISRAKVDVYGPKPGATEGVVVVVGTPDQVHAAQSLIHAFIFCGQAF